MGQFFTETIPQFFTNLFVDWIPTFFKNLEFRDFLDVALVAFLIYNIVKLVRDSRAEQLLKGLLLFVLAFLAVSIVNLRTMGYILEMLFRNILIILIVIFQPEIRRALEQVAQSRIRAFSLFGMSDEEAALEVKRWQKSISAICAAVDMLHKQKMGALIVLERTTKLGEIVNTGTVVDAETTPELLANLFYNKAALHDGAVIIREGRIQAAGCILPLSDNQQISRELGTRHRAGVGMSENSDAMVIILSEETGTVSLAVAGEIKRNFSAEALRVALENGMIWDRTRRDENGEKKTLKTLFRGRKSK